MFKGLTPSLAAVVPTKAAFFYINAKSRQVLANFLHQGQVINLTAGRISRTLVLTILRFLLSIIPLKKCMLQCLPTETRYLTIEQAFSLFFLKLSQYLRLPQYMCVLQHCGRDWRCMILKPEYSMQSILHASKSERDMR